MVLFDAKRREPVPESRFARGAAQGGVERRGANDCGWLRFMTFSFIFIAMVTAEFVYAKSVRARSRRRRK